jgi:hypothetical protein
VHAVSKVFQPTEEERQGALLHSLVLQSFGLQFPRLNPLPKSSDPWLELRAFD